MSILIFIIVIVVLIVVHELGHFVAAKLSGMRVDEFGLGYPPRALVLGKKGETTYTLNWLPFGGFVKIYGEDGEKGDARAFSRRPRILQAIVLVAGVAMNLLFAYVLITSSLMTDTSRTLTAGEIAGAKSVELLVLSVLPGSPAEEAGFSSGDAILSADYATGRWEGADAETFSAFMAENKGELITFSVQQKEEIRTLQVTPTTGLVRGDLKRYTLGVEIATVGIAPLPFLKAVTEGALLTERLVVLTASGLWQFFYGVFTLSADLSQVAGPIGIAGVVGTASLQGTGYLLSIMAIISINLAIINLIPIPALDGGRLLFVIIESITRRPIKRSVARAMNTFGFLFLILLMLVVSAHDILRIIG